MKKNLLFIFALLCTIVQGTRAQGVIDLSQVNSELYLFGGEVLTGTLIANVKISVADGAHITLRNVTIPGSDMFTEYENTEFHSSTKEYWYNFAGISCLGDATITLEGSNLVRGYSPKYPAIKPGPEGYTLTIEGTGSLVAKYYGGEGAGYRAGIGTSEAVESCGDIVIEGGNITACGSARSAGIGGSYAHPCGNITIKGGTVTAYGGEDGAGIGGGRNQNGGIITIGGGTVNAYGGDNGAGIGGGYYDEGNGTGGTIIINGGTIVAMGGSEAAGIGGGEDCAGGNIYIYDGDITATGGDYAAGIGGGDGARGGAIWITGGTVKAYGGIDAAGIGGGEDGNSGSIIINGGNVYACGRDYGVGIGAGEDGDVDNTIRINGGIVEAEGGLSIKRAIGGEDDEDYSHISFGRVKAAQINSISLQATSINYVMRDYLLKTFSHLRFKPCDHEGVTYSITDGTKHNCLCMFCGSFDENHTFDENDKCICGYGLPTHVVRIYDRDNDGQFKETTTLTITEGYEFTLPLTANTPSDYVFECWVTGEPSTNESYVLTNNETRLEPGSTLTMGQNDLYFKARYAYKTLDLATVQSDQKFYDGMIVTGTLNTTDYPVKITIANNATVTLSDMNISGVSNSNYNWAGLTCEGNATIILADGTTNTVRGFGDKSGIFVPENCQLTIMGTGSLDAYGSKRGAGIGSGYEERCGDINIQGGNITSKGGMDASGIGGGYFGGCGNITISDKVIKVTAIGEDDDTPSIGADYRAHCGKVSIGGVVTGQIARRRYTYLPLANAAANESLISTVSVNSDSGCDVILKDRILYRDGEWNTLCLPFDVMLGNSPLAGAEARTLSGANLSDGILTLNFSEPVATLDAGKPYIIRWGEKAADLIISSASDWNTFAQNVNSGEGYGGKVVELATDIEVSTMVGSSETRSFKGRFNGNGHTLTFHNDDSGEFNAPFRYVNGATIYNLHTTGTINTGSKFSSGLVAYAIGTNVINNCWSSIVINSLVSGDGTHGGFVAYTEENRSNLTLNNCLFDGSIIGADTHSCGGLVGWSYDMLTLNNCVCRPESITLVSSNNATFSRGNHVTVNNCYYSENLPGASGQGTAIGGMTNDELVTVLGDDWRIKDDKVIPDDRKVAYSDIVNPAFTNVTITAAEPVNINAGDITFAGTYDPITIGSDGDETMLYLASGNKLYWPNGAMKINAFRAYFQLSVSSNVRGFSMNFLDNEEVTGIKSVNGSRYDSDAWYTLDGRKLSGKPAKGGMYINNGRKLVVK